MHVPTLFVFSSHNFFFHLCKALASLTLEKGVRCPLSKRLGGPHSYSRRLEERKDVLPALGLVRHFLRRPATSLVTVTTAALTSLPTRGTLLQQSCILCKLRYITSFQLFRGLPILQVSLATTFCY